MIKEKNELIKELLSNLKTEDELFEPDTHILENPDHIFNVKESDVTVEKYLTREERAKLDEERRKQEERERAMKRDVSKRSARGLCREITWASVDSRL